jgi:hypothetical protein
MPQYLYRCDCGHTDEAFKPMSQAKYRPKCKCGKQMDRDIGREQRGNEGVHSKGWPMCSDALGVTPKQIPAALAEAKKHGVKVEFNKRGQAIFYSENERRQYAKKHGFIAY